MSAAWNHLLDAALRVGDVLAAGILPPNGPAMARSQTPAFSEEQLAPVWRHLRDTLEVSVHHRLPAVQIRWIFERVLVYFLRRPDGMQLALIVNRIAAGGFDPAAAERLFEEFKSLRET